MIIQHDQSCLPNIDEYELVIDLVEELLDAMEADILLDWNKWPQLSCVPLFRCVHLFRFFAASF